MLTSYEATFAAKWGGKVRDVIEQNPGLLRIRVRQDASAKQMWQLAAKCADGSPAGGGMITAGVGGPLTGYGGNLVVIDDPHKNYDEARSKTYQEKIWDWYRGTLRDRLEPGATIVCIMQRWHENDLAGHLIKHGKAEGETWQIVRLPALAEGNDLLGRSEGEVIWPERFGLAEIEDVKRTLGPYLFEAKWQQNPKPDEGQIFKRSAFRYFAEVNGHYELKGPDGTKRIPKEKCWRFQTTDPAATEKQQSSYFAMGDWIVTPDNDLLLHNVVRERAETTKHKQLMRGGFDRFRPQFQGVEKAFVGFNIIQECAKEGLPIRAVEVDKSKFARALPAQARYEVGTVYHREGAPWLTDFEDEMIAFPNGTHDDQVDIVSQAVQCLGHIVDFSRLGAVGQRVSVKAYGGRR